jgi:hypothetical protein
MIDPVKLKNMLQPFADAYRALERAGYLAEPRGTALMYDVKDPRFLGPTVHDLKPLADAYDELKGDKVRYPPSWPAMPGARFYRQVEERHEVSIDGLSAFPSPLTRLS